MTSNSVERLTRPSDELEIWRGSLRGLVLDLFEWRLFDRFTAVNFYTRRTAFCRYLPPSALALTSHFPTWDGGQGGCEYHWKESFHIVVCIDADTHRGTNNVQSNLYGVVSKSTSPADRVAYVRHWFTDHPIMYNTYRRWCSRTYNRAHVHWIIPFIRQLVAIIT